MRKTATPTHRRQFIGGIAASATAAGLVVMAARKSRAATPEAGKATEFTRWLDGIKGQHKQVYDMSAQNDGMGLVWSWVYPMTAAPAYGVSEKDVGVVLVLRHLAIPFALQDSQWEKYPLGEFFGVTDPTTGKPATRNIYSNLKPGEFFPEAALEKLVARGVKVAACSMAMVVYSTFVAKKTGGNAEQIRKDWAANVVPGVDVVPSGVLALNGAQARGCTYVAAG